MEIEYLFSVVNKVASHLPDNDALEDFITVAKSEMIHLLREIHFVLYNRHKKAHESCSFMSDSLQPHGLHIHGILPARILEWVSHSLLQGMFPAQGSNPGLPHCRRILYQLTHQGSPGILKPIPSSVALPNPGIKPESPPLQDS